MFVNKKLLILALMVIGYCYGQVVNATDTSINQTSQRSEKQNELAKDQQLFDFLEKFGQQASNDSTRNQTISSSTEKPEKLDRNQTTSNQSLADLVEKFRRGEYNFRIGQPIEAYNSEESAMKTYRVHAIEGYGNCIGITTDAFETVVLQCPGKKPEKPGCFDVFTPKSKPQNSTVVPVREMKLACVETININCVGIVTQKFWEITLMCYFKKQSGFPRPPVAAFLPNFPWNTPPRY